MTKLWVRYCGWLAVSALLPAAALAADSPVIFYSDLPSGPNTGGKDGKGAYVTIAGNGFGSSRGTGVVTVGGVPADNYPVWTNTKITFQIGRSAKSGGITAVTANGKSNTVPFTVRPGAIYFVDGRAAANGSGAFESPWKSPASFYSVMKPGDTCYFRAGTYSGKYGLATYHCNVSVGPQAPSGSVNKEIAWVAFPGETVRFDALGGDIEGCFEFAAQKDCYVISGFVLQAKSRPCVTMRGNVHRVVNNDCRGSNDFSYALIFSGEGRFGKIYGNMLHGLVNGNKLSHPIYIGNGADEVDAGWNRIYGNNVGIGPLISINQDTASSAGIVFEKLVIHDNVIDGTPLAKAGPVRAIGFVDQGRGSSCRVYNNIIINCGAQTAYASAVYITSGSVDFFNNTVYAAIGSFALRVTKGPGIPETVRIKNNILAVGQGCDYILIENESEMAMVDVDYNMYYGSGQGPERDVHAVNAPPAFVNGAGKDFRLTERSPAIDAGTYEAWPMVSRDIAGKPRPQGSAFDLGANEFSD